MKLNAICVTGLPGSGKSVVSEVAGSLNIPVIVMGELVFEETIKRGLSLTSENVGKIAKLLRDEYGKDAVAKLVIEKVKKSNDSFKDNNWIVIEGLRSPEEYELFKKFFNKITLIAILASQDERYKRLLDRKREDTERNEKELVKRDFREILFGVTELINKADFYLINEQISLEKYKEKIRSLLLNILGRNK